MFANVKCYQVIKELSEYKVLKDWQVLRELPELLV
jgi:hypothetical protein